MAILSEHSWNLQFEIIYFLELKNPVKKELN